MNKGDEIEVEEEQKLATLEEERQREELKWVLSTKAGRYWMWRLVSQCGVFHSGSAADPHLMAIRSGRRDIGLWIIEQIFQSDDKAFQKMQNEAKEREG